MEGFYTHNQEENPNRLACRGYRHRRQDALTFSTLRKTSRCKKIAENVTAPERRGSGTLTFATNMGPP
jgi:hypothetical protein